MKRASPFLACVLLLGISCTEQSTELTDEQKATIISEVEDQMVGLTTALTQLDFDAWSEYYSKDEFISVSSGVDYFPSFNLWADSVANWWSQRDRQHGEIIEENIYALTPTLVLSTRVIDGEIWTKSEEYFQSKLIHTYLWKKESTGWKIIHLSESFQQTTEE